MPYALTPQNRADVPKHIQNHLQIEPSGHVDDELRVDGVVRIVAVHKFWSPVADRLELTSVDHLP